PSNSSGSMPCLISKRPCSNRLRSARSRRKKQRLVRNGVEAITVCTRHGRFGFERVRLRDASGQEVLWLPEAQSAAWQVLCRWLVNRLSFDDCAHLCRQFQGAVSKSADALWRFVQEQALREDQNIASQIERAKEWAMPLCEPVADVYAQEGEEF